MRPPLRLTWNVSLKYLGWPGAIMAARSDRWRNKYYLDASFLRTDKFMELELFRRYRSETEMMRYIKMLERKDFSLTHGMIPSDHVP